ncbi:hypothetical protein [Mesorhizobium sp. B4-1-4]|uniref:hypothetical protein n=1 Tax=Mesorhizobium sp. B4-1-4 TaxID=2589888 RepID=UPI00112D4A20|nr:hypothetical protein [Mesorhizobium sp. B4-1-4]UCI34316.1 hypothetical protein FJW03_13215 [Mesorhizobium sp. B4-1-4]
MSDTHSGIGGATPEKNAAHLGIADWLCLAAAPTFALMALLSCLQGGDGAMLCMGASPLTGPILTGMPAMYLLMSAFHLAPWLRVISGRQVR